MKVTALAWTPFRLPLRHPFRTTAALVVHRRGLLLRLVTDTGITGLGEASPHPALGIQGLREAEATLSCLAPTLIGADAERLMDALPDGIPPALACALDTASLDAVAKARGVPLARLLSDAYRRCVPVNATIAADSDHEAASNAAQARQAGFSCVKLKVGMALDAAREKQQVAAVRRSLGPDLKLRLDANGAWTAEQAVRTIWSLAEFGLEYVEQPIAPGNLPAMSRVRRHTGVPIAADEDVTGIEAARRVLEAGAADALVIKPMVVGGLRPAMEIAALARGAGVGAVITTTVDAGVATAATLHLAAALPEGSPACGLATSLLLAADIIAQPLDVERGLMSLPRGPGLGVELDEPTLARYTTGTLELSA